jgi:hypothetical protein
MAWADVDGDGDNDCYVGGPKREPGRLFLNAGAGKLDEHPVPDFDGDRESEDTGAVFFDADGDSDPDLYVVSGSAEHPPGDAAYRDRLYLNHGGGKFEKASENALPDVRDSGSVVVACDFDRDKDVDLFVGSRCLPRKYPLPPENRLLVNAGGRLEDRTPDSVRRAGMVTDAVWSDVDGDGWIDLAVTTDWGPVRVFANEKGNLVERTEVAGLADRLGWWLAIASNDLDGDGDADFVVTNVGRNTRYEASPQRPALLYYGDFEGLGDLQILEAKYEGGRIYPRRDLTTLRSVLPAAMSKYTTFDEFGRATLDDIFTTDRLEQAQRFEVNTVESGVLINEGDWRFRFKALPALAQIAPSCGVDIGDVNGDGRMDIVMSQNLYSPHPSTGRMDGGVGLVLVGDGRGSFEALWPDRSGIVVPSDAREVRIVELDGDGRPDVVFAIENGPWRAFLGRATKTSESGTAAATEKRLTGS